MVTQQEPGRKIGDPPTSDVSGGQSLKGAREPVPSEGWSNEGYSPSGPTEPTV